MQETADRTAAEGRRAAPDARAPASLRNRISLRTALVALMLVVGVPVVAFAAFLLARSATVEQERLEREAMRIPRQSALVVQAELNGLLSLLRGLASSSALRSGDYRTFHAEAESLVAGTDAVVLIRETGTTQLLNTQRPYGQPVPPAIPLSAEELAAFEAGQSRIGSVYVSPVDGAPRIPVALPIRAADGSLLILAITVPTARIRDIVLPTVPAGWVLGVGDAQGVYVTRSQQHEAVTGTPGRADYLAQAVGETGTFAGLSINGERMLAGYYRPPQSGWLFAANIPASQVMAPFLRSLAGIGALGGIAVLLSIVAAFIVAQRVAAAADGLSRRAAAIGGGEPGRPVSAPFREFAQIAEALEAADAAIAAREHELRAIATTVPAAVWFTSDADARRVIRNRTARELVGAAGVDAASHPGSVPELAEGPAVPPEDAPLRRAMQGIPVADEELVFTAADGTQRTILANATALRGSDGAITGAVSVGLDISERKRGEEQRRLLINELNHRVKNTLATVQSIASQTLRTASSVREGSDTLARRLIALARAHDVLTRESWEGADLRDVLAGAVGPLPQTAEIVMDGPPAWLGPSLSLSLALAFHELATNAVKHGALSVETGRVRVSWSIGGPPGAPELSLAWAESGGPPVTPPTARGFGSQLLDRVLARFGEAKIEFPPEGVVWRLRAKLGSETEPAKAEGGS